MTAETPAPAWGSLTRYTEDVWTDLPNTPAPYYKGAKDGLYLHRQMAFGRGIVKQQNWPNNWKDTGVGLGSFTFTAQPIPGALMSQIVNFFKRTYERQKTEAAVLLTMNTETGEWGVFIPTQLVSHGGVNYVYDPQHIKAPRIVVGSIHSHCDFSAFHSGTDTGDAADFDGFHATVGFIMRETPQIVAMVSLNKHNMHYQQDQFAALFDYTQLGTVEAPAWWDLYVGPGTGDAKPVGHELYKKFEKPTVVKNHNMGQSYTPTVWKPSDYRAGQQSHSGYQQNNWQPNSEPWWANRTPAELANMGYSWNTERQTYEWQGNQARITKESQEFNARKAAERGNGNVVGFQVRNTTKAERKRLRREAEQQREDDAFAARFVLWEEALEEQTVDAIMDTDLLNEDEWDEVYTKPEVAADPEFWKDIMLRKALGSVEVLRSLGVNITVKITTEASGTTPGKEWLLPEPEVAQQ